MLIILKHFQKFEEWGDLRYKFCVTSIILPDNKTRKGYHKIKEKEGSILDEYRCKIAQQTINKLNLTTY